MFGNPYSSPAKPNADPSSSPVEPARRMLSRAVQRAWVATGLCLVVLAVVSSIYFDRSVTRLLTSDDSYILAFIASVPVTTFFVIGTVAAWWFESTRIEWVATMVPLLCFGGLLIVGDALHHFGEGDELLGYIGIEILMGGLTGAIAISIRNIFIRRILCFLPQMLVGTGYLLAFASMSR